MANWVKWNVSVQHKVVFLCLSLLWEWRCFISGYYTILFASLSIDILCSPLDCGKLNKRDFGKLNKRDFNLLYSQCFFAFLNLAYERVVLSPDLFSHGSRSSSDLLNSLVSDTHNTCFVYRKASLEVAKHEVQPQLDGRTLAMDNTGITLSSLISLSQSKASKEAGFTASSPYQRASTRLWSTLTT